MIDLSRSIVFKLSQGDIDELSPTVAPLLIPDEQIVSCFKAVRDFAAFTNKRLVIVNVQGVTGKRRDFTSLPYSRVQAFSIETAGGLDRNADLELWLSPLGKVRLEFDAGADIHRIGQMIATYVL